jgi:hypothetical protein
MTILYFDLFTSALFFLMTLHTIKRGIIYKRSVTEVSVHKINLLIQHNYWWLVLPYFYSINLISDLESLFNVKSFAFQIVIFLSLLLGQVLFFLKKQPLAIWKYFTFLRQNLQKIHVKFFQTLPKIYSDEQKNELLTSKKNTSLNSLEITFILNSFAFPILLFIANSYFFTKFFFLLFSQHFKSTL